MLTSMPTVKLVVVLCSCTKDDVSFSSACRQQREHVVTSKGNQDL